METQTDIYIKKIGLTKKPTNIKKLTGLPYSHIDTVFGSLEKLKSLVRIAEEKNDFLIGINSNGGSSENYRIFTASNHEKGTPLSIMSLDEGASFIRTVMNIALDGKFVENESYYKKKDAQIKLTDLNKVVTLFYKFEQHPLHAYGDNYLTIIISPLRRNKTSLRTLKVRQREEEARVKAREDEIDLWAKCHSPFFQSPKLDVGQTEILGKILIETIKSVSASTRSKSFILRRFKNKRNKSFKFNFVRESKYKMIAEHSKWAEKERDKLEKAEQKGV